MLHQLDSFLNLVFLSETTKMSYSLKVCEEKVGREVVLTQRAISGSPLPAWKTSTTVMKIALSMPMTIVRTDCETGSSKNRGKEEKTDITYYNPHVHFLHGHFCLKDFVRLEAFFFPFTTPS